MKTILFTDSVNTCECCGKTDLKGTYLVSDESNEYYYGSTCVKRNLKITQSDLTKQINKSTKERKEKAYLEFTLSALNEEYNKALNSNYEYGDDFYLNTVKPLSNKIRLFKNEILAKYNINNF